MRKLLYSAAAAAALAICSTANAAVIVTVPAPPVYTPPTSGGLIGQVNAGATNNDVFTFTVVGAPTLFSGQLSNTGISSGPGNLNFTNIVLDGVSGLFSLVTMPGSAETWACCTPNGNGSVLLGLGEHRLTYTVTNTSNVLGTYAGNFNFALAPAPVPEPATWGMMLLGFAGIGFAMRRSRKPVLAQIA